MSPKTEVEGEEVGGWKSGEREVERWEGGKEGGGVEK